MKEAIPEPSTQLWEQYLSRSLVYIWVLVTQVDVYILVLSTTAYVRLIVFRFLTAMHFPFSYLCQNLNMERMYRGPIMVPLVFHMARKAPLTID
jgi:hypothetical protein